MTIQAIPYADNKIIRYPFILTIVEEALGRRLTNCEKRDLVVHTENTKDNDAITAAKYVASLNRDPLGKAKAKLLVAGNWMKKGVNNLASKLEEKTR